MKLRKNTIVTVTDATTEWFRTVRHEEIAPEQIRMLYLGEIKNMLGHGIFVTMDGKVMWGLHITDYRECTDEEV